jgi:hypothetical protein
VKKLIDINKYYFSKLKFKFFNKKFRKTKPINIYLDSDSKEIQEIYNSRKSNKTLFLQTQVGRGGAKWIMDILNSIEKVRAYGERNPYQESYFRYCNSHMIKNFNEKFLNLLKSEIISDWEKSNVSYLSSPYFSHGINYLYNELSPKKVVILLPSAKRVMTSLKNKGWYKKNIDVNINKFSDLPEEFSGSENHFYGRMISLNIENEKFRAISQIGKIAIFMSQTLKKIYEQISQFENSKILIFRLDDADQNYSYCKNFINKLDLDLLIKEKTFLKLKARTSGKFENKNFDLLGKEKQEYDLYIKEYEFYEKKILKEFDSKHV